MLKERRNLCKAAIALGLCLAWTDAGMAQSERQVLTIGSYGGKVDETIRKAMAGFEDKFNVTLRFVPGTTNENAAKVLATKARPEFDVVMFDDVAHAGLSKAGNLLAKIDPAIVSNYADLRKEARFPSRDAVPLGFIYIGFFYNEEEFKKRGWAAPASWNDIFRPEFCKNFGITSPSAAYVMNLLVLMSGGDVNKVPDSIGRLSKLKGCVPTLESSSAKLEEKIQLGEYLVGVHGSVRVIPLKAAGYPVRFVIPREGTTLISSVASPVAGGKEKLAQEYINWLISPAAQKILVEDTFYVPVNSKVSVPPGMAQNGMPGIEALSAAVDYDRSVVYEKRRDWARQVERDLSP